MALTIPQLTFLLEGEGPILYPRLRPTLEANWANVDEKGVEKILNPSKAEETQKDKDRAAAYRKHHAFYLGIREAPSLLPDAQPIPGLPPETARAIVAFAEADGFPADVWADDVAPIWREIQATAKG